MSRQNKTIQFLYEASKALPSNHLYTAIRSRMLTKCLDINSTNSLKLNLVPRCDACGVVFKDVPPVHFIKPVKKPHCYKKILKSTNNTKYQILSLKKFNKYKNDKQILVTQCKLCKKQIKTFTNKIGHTRRHSMVTAETGTNKKKKRKKNSEFSGLKKSAVIAAKRSHENDNRNCSPSPKKMKINTDVINLVSPAKNILTPNIIRYPNTPDFISLDSPSRNGKIGKTNEVVIEISDSDATISSPKNKKRKKKKSIVQKIEQTPKIKNNNNVVLVAEQSTTDKKKKKLNNLSNFLKNSSNVQQPNKSNLLQNFLSSLT